MTDRELPPLPEPARQVVYNESKGYTFGAYTADQMREYARAVLAQQFADGERQMLLTALECIERTACCNHWLGMNESRRRYAIARDARIAIDRANGLRPYAVPQPAQK